MTVQTIEEPPPERGARLAGKRLRILIAAAAAVAVGAPVRIVDIRLAARNRWNRKQRPPTPAVRKREAAPKPRKPRRRVASKISAEGEQGS